MSADARNAMPAARVSQRSVRLKRASSGIGLLAIAVGVLVLASWLLDVDNRLPMKPVSALCFVLLGVGLRLRISPSSEDERPPSGKPGRAGERRPEDGRRQFGRRQFAVACATVVLLLGAAMLLEYLLAVDLGIDGLLFHDALVEANATNLGRMSVATSLCMAVFGLALLLLDTELPGGHRPTEYLVLFVMVVGLLGLEGNLFGQEAVFRVFPFASMPLPAALLFVTLGFAILHARPDRGLIGVVTSDHVGGLMARRLLPVAILLPLVIAWPRLAGERFGWYETGAGVAIFATATVAIFTIMIWLSARGLNRIDVERRRAAAIIQQAMTDLTEANGRLEAEIVERERAEAVARSSEQRFTALFVSSPAGMVLSSLPDLRYVAVNESWLRITGYTSEQVIGKTAQEVGLIAPEERAALYAGVSGADGLRDAELRFRTSEGELRHGLISLERLAVNGDTFQVSTLVDITDRVHAETELRDSNLRLETTLAELRVAQQQIIEQERIGALGQLASGIAHDFNNTLGPILGYSDLLLANPAQLADVEVATEYLTAINTAAQGAAGVVARLRDFYRRRQHGDAHGPVRLPDVIAQAISITRPRWKDQAQATGVTIDVRAEVEDVAPIDGNASELRDALVNLILNAVDALPAGGAIMLRAHTERSHRERQPVILEVTDTGTGMTDEVRRRCLEPFFTTKGDQGTGLGLSIVHGMLRRHGGTLEIESAVGRGTTMRFRFTARRSPEAEPSRAELELPSRRTLHVLVVDDEPMMREVISRFLTLDDHTVDVAGGGREALVLLQTSAPFDLVITDRAMPEMGGDELAAMIKVLAPSTPVLMLTGFADLMGDAEQRPPGVDLVIGKPTTLARLRVAVAALTGEPAPVYDLSSQ
jgi:PAS domain S-box-containing protein